MRLRVLLAAIDLSPGDWERLQALGSLVWKVGLAILTLVGAKNLREFVVWFMGPRFKETMREVLAPEIAKLEAATGEARAAAAEMRSAAAESRAETQRSSAESRACTDQLQRIVPHLEGIESDVLAAAERTESAHEDLFGLLDTALGIERRGGQATAAREGFADLIERSKARRTALKTIRRSAGLESVAREPGGSEAS